MQKIIIICGATASGKTALSLALAEHLNTNIEIISADSRQIYRELNIGTAKPTKAELNSVPHHFIDLLMPDEDYNAGDFGKQGYIKAIEIAKRGNIPVVVGGSGLYIKALCEGLFNENSKIDAEIRDNLENRLKNSGIDALYNELREIDLPLYEKYSDKNPRHIIRALEYYYSTKVRLSEARKNKPDRAILPKYYLIDSPREKLYARINKRVDIMWENGLVEETERVLNMGYSDKLNSLNTVGYKETISYLKNNISEQQAINDIKQNTRHYAKRQLTWFRKIPAINFIAPNEILETILNDIKNSK